MALNPIILKKINDEITAAQGNVAALNIAYARLALFRTLEEEGKSLSTVKEFDDYFDEQDQDKENVLYTSPDTQSQNKQVDRGNSDAVKVAEFATRVVEVFEKHEKAMDKIIAKHHIISKDPYIAEQQEYARKGQLTTVMTQAEYEAEEKMNQAVDDALPQSPNDHPDVTFARTVVRARLQGRINEGKLNPEKAKSSEFLYDVKAQASNLGGEAQELFRVMQSMSIKQKLLLADVMPLFLTAINTSNNLHTPQYEDHLEQQDRGAKDYAHPKPRLWRRR